MIYPFGEKTPKIHPSVFVADFVTITGDVEIDEDSSVFFNTIIRETSTPHESVRK